MIKITLPDGSVKEFALGAPMDVAKSISEGFARNVISASFNGTTVEQPLFDGGWQSYLIYME
jgi:threonyl-tRNA synthetase